MTELEQRRELRDRAAGIILSFQGIIETAHNRHPLIDMWCARVNIPVGSPWCLALILGGGYLPAWDQMRTDPTRLDRGPLMKFPLPIGGKVIRFWERAAARFKTQAPHGYSIACHAKNPLDPESPGHCGLVLGGSPDTVRTFDGNTNDAGSREGDRTGEKVRPRAYWNLGFVDVGLAP